MLIWRQGGSRKAPASGGTEGGLEVAREGQLHAGALCGVVQVVKAGLHSTVSRTGPLVYR